MSNLNPINAALEALEIIDMVDIYAPLGAIPSEELSSYAIDFLRGLAPDTLDSLERLRTGALASRERILKDMPREV
jgi:hypothetical protein